MSDRAGGSRQPASGSVAQPTIGGVAVADLSAALGTVVWLALAVAGELDAIERALALAPLVLVPLALRTAVTGAFEGSARRYTTTAIWLQPVGALLFAVSLVVPSPSPLAAGLATPWLAVTGLLGLAALARTRTRDGLTLLETAIDAGFAYVSVGAVALHGSLNAFGFGLCATLGWRLGVSAGAIARRSVLRSLRL